MEIISIDRPTLDPRDDRELTALGLQVCIDTTGLVMFLLIRYKSISPLTAEGDSLFFGVDDLLDEIQYGYKVSLGNWRLSSNGETSDVESFIKKCIRMYERSEVYGGRVKVLRRDSEYSNLSK